MNERIKNRLPAALERELAQTQARPSWESANEGVHERVNFDDTLWGFNLAGGSFYNTPLRVTQVKENSRAEHAGIRVGDVLKSINEVDTATLTVKEAHDIILESGLEIKLSLSAPDVEETTRFVYQDKWEEEMRETRRLRELEEQKPKKVFNGAKVNDAFSLAWPVPAKAAPQYKESNCHRIPSKYEQKHATRHEDLTVNEEQQNN